MFPRLCGITHRETFLLDVSSCMWVVSTNDTFTSVPFGQPYCTRGDWEQPRHSTETTEEGKGKQGGGNADLVRKSKKREIRAMSLCKSKSTRMLMHGMSPHWRRAEIHAIAIIFSTFILGYSIQYEQHFNGVKGGAISFFLKESVRLPGRCSKR